MNADTKRRRARFEDPLLIFSRLKVKLYTLWLIATYPFASRGRNLLIQGPCRISRLAADRIRLGNSVTIYKDVWLNVQGDDAMIMIDDDCSIGARTVITAKNSIHIEHDVITATSVLIMDHNHAYEDVNLPIRAQGETAGGRIRIGAGSWIGQGAAIVCNEGELVIGRHSVIGANSLVTRSVPPYSVVVGNPGRVARQYDPVRQEWVMGSVRPVEAETTK